MNEHKQRPVVVVGAHGGIGSALTSALVTRFGYENVLAIHRGGGVHITPQRSINLTIDEHLRSTWISDMATDQLRCAPWGVINLAGKTHPAKTWDKGFHHSAAGAFDDNAGIVARVCSEFAPQMRVSGGGRFINVSSVTAHRPTFGAAAYSASKAWVEGFTRALAHELAPKKVTANCVALGYFNAGMGLRLDGIGVREDLESCIPLGRFGEVDEFAALCDYLLSDNAAYMTGQTLHLNGGLYGA